MKQDFTTTLRHAVSMHGDRPAFRHDDQLLTYAQLGAIVDQKISAYQAVGIHTSSIVGVVADDLAEFLTDVFALLGLQTCSVLLPSDMTDWELERLSSTVKFSHVLRAAPIPIDWRIVPVGRRRLFARSAGSHGSNARGPCLGFLTSGTTGHQKIALRTANAMLVEATSMQRELNLAPALRLAALVPLHHSFGFGDCALSGILAGAEVCTYSWMPPSGYLSAIERDAIEVMALVPAQLRLLAETCNTRAFGNLLALSGGAPLDVRTAQLAHERLGCAVGQVYGTTETGVIAVSRPGEVSRAGVGVPCHHVEVRLDALPAHWKTAVTTEKAEGIVTVRSEALLEGYITPDGIDCEPVRSGWFSTGDCARLVGDRLDLLGRLSCAINVAGVKVSPEEIEAALLEFPAVRSALVAPVDDALAHQRIKAYVTPGNVDLQALRCFCETRLSAAKRPHYYEAVAALATTPSGKLIRRQRIDEDDQKVNRRVPK